MEMSVAEDQALCWEPSNRDYVAVAVQVFVTQLV